jgi:hypothetical protein
LSRPKLYDGGLALRWAVINGGVNQSCRVAESLMWIRSRSNAGCRWWCRRAEGSVLQARRQTAGLEPTRRHPALLEAPRTAEPVVSVAVEARNRADAQRLLPALSALVGEDPSPAVRIDPETGQILLSSLGELHLEVAVTKLRRTTGLQVTTGRPQVAYRKAVTHWVTGGCTGTSSRTAGRTSSPTSCST